jgi:hypothetical protein
MPNLRRLYRWLGKYRFTIFIYPVLLSRTLYMSPAIVFAPLAAFAVAFAGYVVVVLINNRKYGWLIFFGIFVCLPIILSFMTTGSSLLDAALLFSPLITFYVYCLLLRYAVVDWISDGSPIGDLELKEADRQSGLELKMKNFEKWS